MRVATRIVAAALAVALPVVASPLASPAFAQTSGSDQPGSGSPDATPPPFSRECQTPGIRITGDVPLPNVTKALRLRKTIRILSIGASSRGGMSSVDGGYQAIIEGALEKIIPGIDVQMIDRGVSGELAVQAAERMKTEVALVQPDLVLWQVGTHDALMHVPTEEFKATIGGTLDWLKAHDVDVVMVGLHFVRRLVPDKHYQSIRTALRVVADDRKVMRIGRYEAMQMIEHARRTGSGTAPNEFALTDSGYACLSEYVVRALTSGAFARPPRPQPRG